jgi:hypothetical protein
VPNPTQQVLEQARDAIPGQRRIRMPWQPPTLGERAADVVDTLADRAGDFSLRDALQQTHAAIPGQRRRIHMPWQRPTAADRAAGALDTLAESATGLSDRASMVQAQTMARAQVARDVTFDRTRALTGATRDRARDVANTARDRSREMANTARERLTDAQARFADQVAAARDRAISAAAARDRAISAAAGTAAAGTGATLGTGIAAIESSPADKAVASAEQAARATDRAAVAANQVASLLDRLLTRVNRAGAAPAAGAAEPTDVEIRIGEAAQSPLSRAADAIARAVEAAGETIYDYSEGHYGMEPIDASELRRERKRELGKARPIAIIEGHYDDGERAGGSWLPTVALILGAGAGVLGIAIWQRRRLQAAASQALATGRRTLRQVQQQVSGPSHNLPGDISGEVRPDRFSPTPAFDQVVSGALLSPHAVEARANSAETGRPASTTSAADGPPTVAG